MFADARALPAELLLLLEAKKSITSVGAFANSVLLLVPNFLERDGLDSYKANKCATACLAYVEAHLAGFLQLSVGAELGVKTDEIDLNAPLRF